MGFTGASHAYVCLRAAQHLQRRVNELEIVSCHLGNGASLCAVDHGRSVDTSMGLTPGEGLIMGTRCGDLDPGVVAYLEREEGLTGAQIDELLNKRSGLLGLSGISSDMREIEQAADAGNPRALVALKAFSYRVRKYIGAYLAAMGGLDVLVFTGGIGQGSAGVRSLALQGLQCMGIHLDESAQPRRPRLRRDLPHLDRRFARHRAGRADRRGAHDRPRNAARAEPLLPRARDGGATQRTVSHRSLRAPHPPRAGTRRGAVRPGPSTDPAQRPLAARPVACQEQLTIVGPKGRVERVRVLGPARKATQVEISMTEQFKLGIHPPIRESGDIQGTPGCTLEGPAGSVTLERGVICALRHIHMTPADALRYGVRDKSTVRVRVPGDRELIFGDVRIRVDPNFRLAMHIDTDEANAANLKTGVQGYLDGIQSQD